MSWIDKEVKKRSSAAPPKEAPAVVAAASESDAMTGLWARFESANAALPAEIRLQVQTDPPPDPMPDQPRFRTWLHAPNGAALGFTGDAVRYVWPERSARKSRNFWIRWTGDGGYRVSQRIGSVRAAHNAEYRFDERRVDDMVRRLVTGRLIKPSSLRRKRFWLF